MNSKTVAMQAFHEHDTGDESYHRNLFHPICSDCTQNQEKNLYRTSNHPLNSLNPDTVRPLSKSEYSECLYSTNTILSGMCGDEHLDSNSFSTRFGCICSFSTLLSIIVIIPEDDFSMRELCDSVMLSLSQRFIFCQISVYRKDEYIFALGNTYCDLCIVCKELLNVVSLSFPSVCCAGYSYSSLKVWKTKINDW